MTTGEIPKPEIPLVDVVALGKKVGNIVNGLPEFPSIEDIQAARDAARMGLLEQLESFDEIVCPEEVEWGVPARAVREPNDPFIGVERQDELQIEDEL